MDQLTYAPTTGQFFLWTCGEGTPSLLLTRLRALGWPAAAQIVRGDSVVGPVEGVLIELIDALPLLCGGALEDVNPSLRFWTQAARLGISLIERGHMVPKLRARRGRGGDERVAGWEARWAVLPGAAERQQLAQLSGAVQEIDVALPRRREAGREWVPTGKGYAPAGLLRRFLDTAADTLVREASRRGVYVRLGGWPSDAWEQRLVRALGEDRAGFAAGELDVAEVARQLQDWLDDQALSPSLLPSPPLWLAGESLQQVLERLIAPARLLSQRLAAGEPAPRTLAPVLPRPQRSRASLNQAIAVTRALAGKLPAAETAPGRKKAG
jgi:hypothetical protein